MASRYIFTLTLIYLLPFIIISSPLDDPRDQRVLVLLDDLALKSSHSIFFNSLLKRGIHLDFKLADDPNILLKTYGQYLYDALILFAPATERLGGSLNLAAILEFIDSDRDLIVAADENASDLIRNIGIECGVLFDEDPSTMVIDHLSYAVVGNEGDHTLIASDELIQSDVILGSRGTGAPVLFKGIGHSSHPANSYVLKVLSGSPSAYSANPASELSSAPTLTGTDISLVSVVQARNNARILLSGSLDLFSDRLFKSSVQKAGSLSKYEKSGNEEFVTELSKWVFHEKGHLKAMNVRHHKVGETAKPESYRIKDDLEYSIEIYEWSGASWEPYIANDVQLQFYMMSPYVLRTLTTDQKGLYYTSFKVPDVYGVFQFKIEYNKIGYTSLSVSKQIPVRPFRHNEYERFLTTAFPYYGASFTTMVAFFLFSIIYLYNK
ncbi:hypothetical protein DCAR_0208835 [Daucus carota subsp. sativus]|uniref:Dolichyl-diphosphooligosaccharide--protein glycosyltransferase 48 kDa subunit n=1 Tax=Daucus carota subsp. sativus TaxID=79200 RepID=A0AAF1AQV8_DAUCS|nr:PREDICTED: dolichyl-diphosphooligosaccharide--protein glycosyltransferase 48 kDa subunit-like [Daucus carota subsp. sativus]WOG89597.1 hypothetical protein DCAR_0208835 [Daucus carota subsp. sativus]